MKGLYNLNFTASALNSNPFNFVPRVFVIFRLCGPYKNQGRYTAAPVRHMDSIENDTKKHRRGRGGCNDQLYRHVATKRATDGTTE